MTTSWHDPRAFDPTSTSVANRDGASAHPGELIRKIVTHIALRQSQWPKSPGVARPRAHANRFFRD